MLCLALSTDHTSHYKLPLVLVLSGPPEVATNEKIGPPTNRSGPIIASGAEVLLPEAN